MNFNLPIAAGAAALAVLTSGQDPTFNYQFLRPTAPQIRVDSAAPQVSSPQVTPLPQTPAAAPPAPAPAPQTPLTPQVELKPGDTAIIMSDQAPQPADKVKISLDLDDAPVNAVLDQLKIHGFNYLIASNLVPDGKKVSIHAHDLGLQSIANAIAEALGGHWENRSGLNVFRTNRFEINSFAEYGMPGQSFSFNNPSAKGQTRTFTFKSQGPTGMDSDKLAKDLQKVIVVHGDSAVQPEVRVEIERALKDAEQGFKSKDMKQGPLLNESQMKAFEETWKSTEKYLSKAKANSVGSQQRWLFRTYPSKPVSFDDLSPSQQQLMRKRGFLYFHDLNQNQKQQMPNIDGKFEIKMTRNGHTVVIKSDK